MVTLREWNETWFRKEESAKAVVSPRKTRKKSGHSSGREGKAMIKAENDTWSQIPKRAGRRRQGLWKRAIPVVKAANKYLFEK